MCLQSLLMAEALLVLGDGAYTAKIAYTIIVFGAVILGLRLLGWYYEWPW